MNDIIWNPREVKNKITDEHLLDILFKVMPIYSTNDFLIKIAGLGRYSKDVAVTGMDSFLYKNRVLFKYISQNKAEHSKCVYEGCRQAGLADYDLAVVDNRRANSFYLIFLEDNDSFSNYAGLPWPDTLDYSQRNSLYCVAKELTEKSIFISLNSVSYNKTTGRFSLFDYSGVIIDESRNAEEIQEYLNAYKKFLLYDR